MFDTSTLVARYSSSIVKHGVPDVEDAASKLKNRAVTLFPYGGGKKVLPIL